MFDHIDKENIFLILEQKYILYINDKASVRILKTLLKTFLELGKENHVENLYYQACQRFPEYKEEFNKLWVTKG